MVRGACGLAEVHRVDGGAVGGEQLVEGEARARKLLLELVILPKRSPKSAEAYASIFKNGESPLITFTESFVEKVTSELEDTPIAHGYLIGKGPYLDQALNQLKDQGCTKIRVIPLFPQYAEATTLSARDGLEKNLAKVNWQPEIEFTQSFHNTTAFVKRLRKKLWRLGTPLHLMH